MGLPSHSTGRFLSNVLLNKITDETQTVTLFNIKPINQNVESCSLSLSLCLTLDIKMISQ